MTPEEFDLDFDFDKEYGYAAPSAKDDADDFDLDAALARELGPDFDAQFEKEFAEAQAALNADLALATESIRKPLREAPAEQTRLFARYTGLEDTDPEDAPAADADEPEEEPEAFPAAPAEEPPQPDWDAGTQDDSDPDADISDLFAAPANSREYPDDSLPWEEERWEEEDTPRREAPRLDLSAIGEQVRKLELGEKLAKLGLGEKLAAVGAVAAENGRNFVDALKDIKPGKMDKHQKRRLKNDVLPILIGGAAFILCLCFIFGALGRTLNADERQAAALQESLAQAEEDRAAAAEIENVLSTAARQAAGYDYQTAINTLESYRDPETGRELTDEMAAARAEYTAAMTDLVVWDDPAAIPNLSFHILIEDPDRAYRDASNGGAYQKNFVTTAQFSAILELLHENGYVLVNLESCIEEGVGADGETTYTTKPIYLPAGKTPIMITETLVNYFGYMVDGDDDGTPDAGGSGFAHRLVVDGGEIKAEYIDANGQSHVGDYDLVPILNTFIDAHPDFSYRGAKAILAVTGSEGVFGWRTNTDNSAVDRVKDIAEILRADGYQIASNSFANLDYSGKTTTAQITADLDRWATEITPILGEVDIMVIAWGSGIKTRGAGFQLMEEAGFHYILDCTGTATGELTQEYFHQHRLMVTGENLTSGIFDDYFTFDTEEAA